MSTARTPDGFASPAPGAMSTPKSMGGESSSDPLFSGAGEMAALMRATDWSTTPLVLPADWDRSLRTVVRIMLTSRYAMWMGWGPTLTFFYNYAYAPTLGAKHPWALGQPARQVWAEIWEAIGPRIDTVLQRCEATWDEGLLLFLERNGYPEETFHTFTGRALAPVVAVKLVLGVQVYVEAPLQVKVAEPPGHIAVGFTEGHNARAVGSSNA